MKTENWSTAANDFVERMEAECKADKKAFWNENDGSNRAKSAIQQLDRLKQRLQAFVRG